MSKIITASKLNRLWQNGILPIKQDVDNHKTETEKALTNINTALDVMEEKVDGVVENGSGSKIFCTCTGDNAIGTVLTGTLNGKTYTATIGTDGIATFILSDCGTFVISGTEEYSVSATVVMEYFGIYRIELASVTIESWIEAGGLNPDSYTSLDGLLEDEAAVRTLMTKTAAVDKMKQMSIIYLDTIINHRYAAKWINYREYAYSILSAREDIKALMDESGMYGMYITAEKPKALVPVMTSNTAPSGYEVKQSSIYSGGGSYYGYKAFDNDFSTTSCWNTDAVAAGQWIQIKLPNATIVKSMSLTNRNNSSNVCAPKEFILQGSNDGLEWDNIATLLNKKSGQSETSTFDIDNNEVYLYYRVYIVSGYVDKGLVIGELQFYGYQEGDILWQPKGLVPVMTSTTAPYGKSSANGLYDSSTPSNAAFDGNTSTKWTSANGVYKNSWIQYDFVIPTKVSRIMILPTYMNADPRVKNFIVQGSNDTTNFEDIYSGVIDNTVTSDVEQYFNIENDKYYMSYRVFVSDSYVSNASISITSLQFYGRQLEALIQPMTSNTAPIGEVSASSTYSNNYPYKAFDGKTNTTWTATGVDNYIIYEFPNEVILKRLSFVEYNGSGTGNPNTARFYTSMDGNEWDLIASEHINSDYSIQRDITLKTLVRTKYIKFHPDTSVIGTNSVGLTDLQCYGAPDHDSRTYIYDHGVEVMEVQSAGAETYCTVVKNSDNIHMTMTGTNASTGTVMPQIYSSIINTTNYKIACLKTDLINSGTRWAVHGISKTVPTKVGNSSDTFSATLTITEPNTTLDITAVNQERYPVVFNNATVAVITIAEWWFE